MKKKGLKSVKQLRNKRKRSIAERRRKSLLRKQLRSRLVLYKRNDQLLNSEFRQKLRLQKLDDIRDQIAFALKPALLITTLKQKINKSTCEAINTEVQNTLHFVYTMMHCEKLRNFIQQQIRLGFNCGDTLAKVLDSFEFPFSSELRNNRFKWFQILESGRDLSLEKILPNHLELLKLIHGEWKLMDRALKARVCSSWRCKFSMLSERYAIDVKEVDDRFKTLTLLDLFHGQKGDLQLDGKLPSDLNPYDYILHVINSNYILYASKNNSETRLSLTLSLLKLDYNKWKCSFVQSFTLPGYYSDFKIISNNPDKLIFFVKSTFENHCYSGKLENSQVEITGTFLMQHYVRVWNSVMVKDDKLTVLDVSIPDSTPLLSKSDCKICIDELKFEDGEVRLAKTVEFKIDDGNCWSSVADQNIFAWVGQQCYSLRRNGGRGTPLFKIDLEAKNITQLGTFDLPYILEMHITDDESMLVLCSRNISTRQHITHYIPLEAPVKLNTLAMIAVHKSMAALNEIGYERLCKKLPPNLRAFGKEI